MHRAFKKGDVVMIKDKSQCRLDRVGVASPMLPYFGTIAEVDDTFCDNNYSVMLHESELDGNKDICGWSWDVDWLELVEEDAVPEDIDPNVLLALL